MTRLGWVVATGFMLAACGSTPSGTPDASSAGAERLTLLPRKAPGAASFERRLRDRALAQGRQGRLAEAALSWEILTVLRPESSDYRDRLADTQRLIDTVIPERLQRGAQAHKRGELDVATAHYLTVVSLQPEHRTAAEALRQIERDRNKRLYLGKPSRLTLTRRAAAEAQVAPAIPPVPLDVNEVEHASMLAAQGEFNAAIALLERHLAVDKEDAEACQLLADIQLRKAEKQPGKDAGALHRRGAGHDESSARTAAQRKMARSGEVASASGRLGECASP